MDFSEIIYKSRGLSRVAEISIKKKKLITPTYFPSLSTYGIKYSFPSLVNFLISYSYPRLLISTYDFCFLDSEEKEPLLQEIEEYRRKGGFVFVDSGVFESSWKSDQKWTFDSYKSAITEIDCDFYTSLDILPDERMEAEVFEKETFKNILGSQSLSKEGRFIPILHGLNPNQLVSILTKFVELQPRLCNIIAIAERDCGNDIVEKAITIKRIRQVLDEDNSRRILHILGCGHPISLALFSYCGADTFDSLDWIKCVVDKNRLAFNDFSYLELTRCDCSICTGKQRDYIEKVLLHNLKFYQEYLLHIQSLIRKDQISDFISKQISEDMLRKIDNETLN